MLDWYFRLAASGARGTAIAMLLLVAATFTALVLLLTVPLLLA